MERGATLQNHRKVSTSSGTKPLKRGFVGGQEKLDGSVLEGERDRSYPNGSSSACDMTRDQRSSTRNATQPCKGTEDTQSRSSLEREKRKISKRDAADTNEALQPLLTVRGGGFFISYDKKRVRDWLNEGKEESGLASQFRCDFVR